MKNRNDGLVIPVFDEEKKSLPVPADQNGFVAISVADFV